MSRLREHLCAADYLDEQCIRSAFTDSTKLLLIHLAFALSLHNNLRGMIRSIEGISIPGIPLGIFTKIVCLRIIYIFPVSLTLSLITKNQILTKST